MLVSLTLQEKEAALNLTVDTFCRLVKQHANVAQLVTMYGCHSSFGLLNSLWTLSNRCFFSMNVMPIIPETQLEIFSLKENFLPIPLVLTSRQLFGIDYL